VTAVADRCVRELVLNNLTRHEHSAAPEALFPEAASEVTAAAADGGGEWRRGIAAAEAAEAGKKLKKGAAAADAAEAVVADFIRLENNFQTANNSTPGGQFGSAVDFSMQRYKTVTRTTSLSESMQYLQNERPARTNRPRAGGRGVEGRARNTRNQKKCNNNYADDGTN
jgi:hypothetical protein